MRRVAGRGGQAPTEYLMMAGLLTAMIIVLSGIIIPTMREVTVRLARQIIVNLSSPTRDEQQPPPCPEYVELDPEPGEGEDFECEEQ